MKTFYLFLLLVGTAMFLSFSMNLLIYTDDAFFTTLIDRYSAERIEELLNQRKEWAWLGYAFTPIIYGLKILLVASCLYLGVFFSRIEISFSQLVATAIKAEFVFFIPLLVRLVWFSVVKTEYTLQEVNDFPPLSLDNLFHNQVEEIWILYPLSIFNVFELIYMVVISVAMTKEYYLKFWQSFQLVIKTYGTGLLLWCVLVAFLLISIS